MRKHNFAYIFYSLKLAALNNEQNVPNSYV